MVPIFDGHLKPYKLNSNYQIKTLTISRFYSKSSKRKIFNNAKPFILYQRKRERKILQEERQKGKEIKFVLIELVQRDRKEDIL